MIKDEALKLMAKAIEDGWSFDRIDGEVYPAIKEALAQPESDYERGFIDGMQKQMQSSVDKAVNRMAQPEQEPVAWEQFYPDIGKPQIAFNAEVIGYVAPQRTWVGLTVEEIDVLGEIYTEKDRKIQMWGLFAVAVEAKLKEKNT